MLKLIPLIFLFCFLSTCHSQQMTAADATRLAESFGRTALQEYLEFLRLPNDAHNPADLEPNLQWLTATFVQRGFNIQRLPNEGIDLLLAQKIRDPSLPTLLIYLQVDGQPVDPSKWDQDSPWEPILKKQNLSGEWETIAMDQLQQQFSPEWRIFARSAADAKGPIVMLMAALDIIQAEKIVIPYNLKIIMDPEEELGSPHLPAAVKQFQNELAAERLIILDGPMHSTNRPTLVFGARGIGTLRLTVYGPKVPLHSGHYGNYAPNPALRLSQLLASMKDDHGRVTIPGFYDGVNLSDQTREILAAVPDNEENIRSHIGIKEPDQVGSSLQEAIQYPSLNIQGLSAGWVGSKVRTIIPHAAVANLDIRLVKESSAERLFQLIKSHIEAKGYHLCTGEPTDEERSSFNKLISIKENTGYAAFRTEMNTPIDDWLSRALRNIHLETPIRIRTHGGSVPISPFVKTLNIPAVLVPLVNPDNNQHSPNENLRIGNFFEGIKSCIGILQEPW